jgi:hypothetical protein
VAKSKQERNERITDRPQEVFSLDARFTLKDLGIEMCPEGVAQLSLSGDT